MYVFLNRLVVLDIIWLSYTKEQNTDAAQKLKGLGTVIW